MYQQDKNVLISIDIQQTLEIFVHLIYISINV
jgi:hypothetical protein